MKQNTVFSQYPLSAWLCLLCAVLTLVSGGLLYIGTAVDWLATVTLLVIALAFGALFWWCGEHSRAVRIVCRIAFLLPTVLMTLLLIVYYFALRELGYPLVRNDAYLLVTMLPQTGLLFAAPCTALAALRGTRFDRVVNRTVALLNVALAVFTVFFVSPLTDSDGAALLITLLNFPLFDALFLLSAACTAFFSLKKQ